MPRILFYSLLILMLRPALGESAPERSNPAQRDELRSRNEVSSKAQANLVDCAVQTPNSQSLQAEGVRIRRIIFSQNNIFDETKPGERTRLYKFANRLHVKTKPSALRAQLLFAEGDLYSERVLQETARNLRTLRYLREPVLTPVCYSPGFVDVRVQTRDVWTLVPTFTFGRKGGNNATSFGVEDNNFLGFGKVLELSQRSDRKRDSTNLIYRDPNLAFGRWTLNALVINSSDGHNVSGRVEHPFYALDSRWQAVFGLSDFDGEQSRSVFGDEIDRYRQQSKLGEVGIGFSNGLVNGWSTRYFTGLRYERQRFSALVDVERAATAALAASTLAVPTDRTLAYPYVRIEGIQDDFTTTFNQDQIGRTEDQAFGINYSLELGASLPALGGDRNQALLQAKITDGLHIGDKEFLFLNAYADGRFIGNGENQRAGVGARYFYRQSDRATFFASVSADYGRNLDAESPFVLGGENGLRAYPFDYQYGDRRAQLTLEQRIYTDWKPFQLFQVGAAVFVDVAKVSGNSPVPAENLGTLKDIGIGLRLGSLRAARANSLHIDLAYPIDARSQDRGLQFIVETRTSF